MELLNHPVGIISIILFIIAYAFVMTEEVTHLRKSKPVLFVAGLIWAMIAWVGVQTGDSYAVKKEIMHAFDEFNQLMLFLLVAMTYINSMSERNVFEKLRSILLNQDFSYKKLFWITGLSGSGKTTLANKIAKFIRNKFGETLVLSGDDLRAIFNYSKLDRNSRYKYALSYIRINFTLNLIKMGLKSPI